MNTTMEVVGESDGHTWGQSTNPKGRLGRIRCIRCALYQWSYETAQRANSIVLCSGKRDNIICHACGHIERCLSKKAPILCVNCDPVVRNNPKIANNALVQAFLRALPKEQRITISRMPFKRQLEIAHGRTQARAVDLDFERRLAIAEAEERRYNELIRMMVHQKDVYQ